MDKLPFEEIKRKAIVKKKEATDESYGKKPEERSIAELINYGVINLDKNQGPTSHQVTDYVKRILNIKKSGHSGTLDPNVTGCLPIALGKGTRIVQTLLKSGKEYVCLMNLHSDVEEGKIRGNVKKFIGKIEQMPPVRSAVKRQNRFREVYYFNILEINGRNVLFKVGCEAGTYIRKLCLHPETKILTDEGFVSASEFYSNPQKVYSYDKGKIIKKIPSVNQKLKSPSKLIKIIMDTGISLTITKDHKMLVAAKKGYKMLEAQKLKKGDYFVKSSLLPNFEKKLIVADLLDDYYLVPQVDIKKKCKEALISKYGSIREMHCKLKLDRKAFLAKSNNSITIRHLKLAGIYDAVKKEINLFKTQKGSIIKMNELDEDFFYLLGLIASDGNNSKEKNTNRYTRIKFHNEKEVLIDSFLDSYKKIFPEIPISKKKVKSNLFQLDTSNSFLATIAASLGIKSPQKYSDISPILNVHSRLIKAFLKGYFDGDGSVVCRKKVHVKGNYNSISIHTVDYLRSILLHKMLLKVGISSRIFKRKMISERKHYMYEVKVGNTADQKKFVMDIGTNHPEKIKRFNKILDLKSNLSLGDYNYIGFHFKEFIRNNKSKLSKMGGNLSRVLNSSIPITKGFYKKSSKIVSLPALDSFIIEKIKSIELVDGTDYVYDMTIPETHNFLIETGYVSSNCHDFGKSLGTGANMVELVRTKAGPFVYENSVSLIELKDAYEFYKKGDETALKEIIQKIEDAVAHLPKVWVLDSAVDSICNGADLSIPGISKLNEFEEGEIVAIMTLKDELVGLGQAMANFKNVLDNNKGKVIKIKKVFMDRGVYPKYNKNG